MKKLIYLVIITLSIIIFSNRIYAYKSYKIGDVVTYNDIEFYVIKDSSSDSDNVTLLKAEPLTVEEVNNYGGVGTANNHVNMYNASSNDSYYHQAYNSSGYGGMAYYTSETCGYINNDWVTSGCTKDYAQSEVKYVVDAWKSAQTPAATESRLITFEDLTENLGFEFQQTSPTSQGYKYTENTPSGVYNSSYWYLTMSQYNDMSSDVWSVSQASGLSPTYVYHYTGVVRPVITISKSAIEAEEKSDDNTNKDVVNDSKEVSKKNINNTVRVPNTLKSLSELVILIGLVLVCVGLNVFIIFKNKDINKK